MGCYCRGLRALISYFLFCCFLSFYSSQAASSISQGQSIRDGQTIISPDGVFALGFFNTSKSPKRYVGIWYNSIPIQTVVWVANRDKPVADSSGILTIGSTGDLEVKDGNGQILWSTNATTTGNTSAVLEDSGNLVLQKTDTSNNSRVVWESFHHPTDTLLPGMRAELDLKTGENDLFRSWKFADDPSPGNFTQGLDPSGTAQTVIWNGPIKWWRSGQWNGQSFTGIVNMRPLNLYGFKLMKENKDGKMYITYSSFDPSSLLRLVIRWHGKGEQMQWNKENKTWSVIWTQPTSECEIYGKCGVFGVCSDDGRSPNICNCLRGFEPRSGEEWRKGDWRGGCVRRSELGCGRNESRVEKDGFVRVSGVKLPDSSDWVVLNGERGECEERCLGNCSCRAYAYASGIGCMTWDVDLMDIRTFETGGNDLYLRLAHSELGESKISKKILIVILVLGAVFLSMCAYGFWRWRSKLKGCWKKTKDEKTSVYDLRPSKELSAEFSGPYEFGEAERGKVTELTYFSFSCVANATDNFSDENMLGQGGFGPVYKGMLPGGQEIAAKRLSKTSGQGLEEFKNEVMLIANLQHRNLVRILGCCIQGDERILLYEYMPNKSLDFFIFDSTRQLLLDWAKRFSIIEGIARGLLYLHRDSRLRIIHRDLKPSNVLLDEEMNPKISDFGMARIFGGNQNHANTNRVVGTYGYMSPEYGMEGLFSVKSDVYSFGVLILEIVSGKKNNSMYHHGNQTFNLLGHAWKLWNEDRGTELMDPSLGNSYVVHEVLRCINVGLLCVQDHAAARPNMSSVVLMLESERSRPHPKPPTFSLGYSRETETMHTVSGLEEVSHNGY